MKSTIACKAGGCRSVVDELHRDDSSQGSDGRYIRDQLGSIERHTRERAEVYFLPALEPMINRVPGRKAGQVRLRLGPVVKGRPRRYSHDPE